MFYTSEAAGDHETGEDDRSERLRNVRAGIVH